MVRGTAKRKHQWNEDTDTHWDGRFKTWMQRKTDVQNMKEIIQNFEEKAANVWIMQIPPMFTTEKKTTKKW